MYKLIVVRFDSSSGSFDDAEFNRFCEQHSILKIEKETLNSILTAFGVQAGLINHAFTVNYTAGLDFKQQNQWLGLQTAGAVQSLDTHQLKLMERPDKSSVTMR
ncbi:MAG: hypothetical protein LHW64_09065 [Candidatus Cloacimonetes bacterium]|jgi:hypothetical protein|nr:hypothetical protein [Candidatus Cloacimonadota bacterium]MCK9585202.1 hypothetical protein [Candidatus Cloacimonadota bacterium]MDY0230260.1 hypothetical protein [Candidatus Cloacimonadaceae bacterium]